MKANSLRVFACAVTTILGIIFRPLQPGASCCAGGSPRETDMVERAKEILALTKMNWNSADGMGRHPITLSFARQVGAIMTEIDDGADIHPLYRFYM